MIIPVIMAGGVGSRLWPVSRELYPKQFISFQPGQGSLFQETLGRLQGLDTVEQPLVVCNQEHRFLVAEQMRQVNAQASAILLEPVGRNTAPAVALAALEAARRSPEAVLLVLAADHLLQEVGAFQDAVREGARQAEQGRLVTFGIVPDKPETGFGYIKRGDSTGTVYAVERFVEKPDLDTAENYLASGDYYWNSGMFMFTAGRYLEELEQCNPVMLDTCRRAHAAARADLDFLRIPEDVFADCPSDSIDYAVMEQARDCVVVPLDAGWSDLGAWNALWEYGNRDKAGNVAHGDVVLHEVRNSFVRADSRLVSLVGIDNVVVVETRDAVLVAERDKVQDVKAVVSLLKDAGRAEAQTHRLVHRPWGSYESLADGEGFQVKRIIVNPGGALSLQMHHHRAEHWVVVRGSARVTRGEEVFTLEQSQSTFIPVETRHRLENPGTEPVVLIEVQCGDYLGEDDIVRLEDVYGRQDKQE